MAYCIMHKRAKAHNKHTQQSEMYNPVSDKFLVYINNSNNYSCQEYDECMCYKIKTLNYLLNMNINNNIFIHTLSNADTGVKIV